MTERQTRPISGQFSNREEYRLDDATTRKYLKNEVLEDVDALLQAQRAETQPGYHYEFKDGIGLRDLQLSMSDVAIQTDAAVRDAHFREGVVEQSTEVTLREFIRGTRVHFLSQYTIEQFRGGSFQALYTTKDPEHYDLIEQHQMTPYDFTQMGKTVRQIKAMQYYELLTDKRRESLRQRGLLG